MGPLIHILQYFWIRPRICWDILISLTPQPLDETERIIPSAPVTYVSFSRNLYEKQNILFPQPPSPMLLSFSLLLCEKQNIYPQPPRQLYPSPLVGRGSCFFLVPGYRLLCKPGLTQCCNSFCMPALHADSKRFRMEIPRVGWGGGGGQPNSSRSLSVILVA